MYVDLRSIGSQRLVSFFPIPNPEAGTEQSFGISFDLREMFHVSQTVEVLQNRVEWSVGSQEEATAAGGRPVASK